MSALCVVELALWATLGFLLWKNNLVKRFPVISAYIALQIASALPLLALIFYIFSHPNAKYFFLSYFCIYWAAYLASAVLLFFICIEIFRSVLAGFPGLTRIGLLVFRWAALVSIIVSLTFLPHVIRGIPLLVVVAETCYAVMRAISVLVLCLLTFLCISMNALRLSPRDTSFGFTIGFGVMSCGALIISLFWSLHTTMTSPMQFVCEGLTLLALVIWIAYAALPEPVRKPVLIPASSTIYRWDQIASALGHKGTQIVVQQPVQGFFLTDVEKVVDRVMARNTGKRGSDL